MKVLFFHVPSQGMYNLIEPVLLELTRRGDRVIHYNGPTFASAPRDSSIELRSYRDYHGYLPDRFDREMSLFDLGLLLLETAEHIVEFVRAEVVAEAPDAILFSKFMVAPKVIARTYSIPSACLTTGYVFHPEVALDREEARPATMNMANVRRVREFRQRARAFYERHLAAPLDANDVFVNEATLNLVLGLELFQPGRAMIPERFRFIGPPVDIDGEPASKDLIYVSLGSIFSSNRTFFDVCLRALATMGRVVISLGGRLSPTEFAAVPANIDVVRFAAQKDLLRKASVFITHGGAGGVYEAIAAGTPMIVVPQIPEQAFYGRTVARLGLGRCLHAGDLTVELLRTTVQDVLGDAAIARNVRTLRDSLPLVAPAVTAGDAIHEIAAVTSHDW